jgi:hypothetical protein
MRPPTTALQRTAAPLSAQALAGIRKAALRSIVASRDGEQTGCTEHRDRVLVDSPIPLARRR